MGSSVSLIGRRTTIIDVVVLLRSRPQLARQNTAHGMLLLLLLLPGLHLSNLPLSLLPGLHFSELPLPGLHLFSCSQLSRVSPAHLPRIPPRAHLAHLMLGLPHLGIADDGILLAVLRPRWWPAWVKLIHRSVAPRWVVSDLSRTRSAISRIRGLRSRRRRLFTARIRGGISR